MVIFLRTRKAVSENLGLRQTKYLEQFDSIIEKALLDSEPQREEMF
jgi:hypothetical protein